MDGPSHYREAERILREGNDRDDWLQALTHATLAQVAVAVDRHPGELKHSKQWVEVTS